MRVDLHFIPHQTDEMLLRDRTIVVIDVLRASTTIAVALNNGAKEIIPATTVESAVKISGNLFGDVTLLGGERNGKIVEGFHLGNSPSDYSEERVRGKSIIFSSTNGSQAMAKSRYAREMVVCGFVNMSAVVDFLKEPERDFTIVCAGNNGLFSLEDAVCAGMVISRLSGGKPTTLDLSDGALAAASLFKSYGRSIVKMIKASEHGIFLQQIGFGDDLPVCAGVDTIPVLPLLEGNVVRLKREPTPKETGQSPVQS